MKRIVVPVVLLASLTALLLGTVASGKDASSSKAGTSRYLVISPHTPEECLKALDDVSAMGASTLKMWDFGCKSGDHTGYLVINATSEEQALSKVPTSLRDKAKVIKVTKFTAEDIKMAHQQMNTSTPPQAENK